MSLITTKKMSVLIKSLEIYFWVPSTKILNPNMDWYYRRGIPGSSHLIRTITRLHMSQPPADNTDKYAWKLPLFS
jgi:hypothetical protein